MGVSAASFECNMNAEELVSVPIPVGKRRLRNNTNKYRRKRRQHSCKVCSAMAEPNTKSFESSFYCPSCEVLRGGGLRAALRQVHLRKNIRYRKRKREDSDSEDSDEGEEHDVNYVDTGDSD
ncbi:hypothetical protein F441_00387 [Phytophthora nicotianae CJ01A1]|uniref:PiggyBac transposable element-derived protein 4 C-terminal zinc-ribbon domain-containing protein n=1 Tax=Phytophthora nicotianae CJ01A1 TaxID=1317063 RepID=W2XWG3_PHYNI|nr:hypothetical protein F441_00387 [Phytophthora nicotianae CJ01A1]